MKDQKTVDELAEETSLKFPNDPLLCSDKYIEEVRAGMRIAFKAGHASRDHEVDMLKKQFDAEFFRGCEVQSKLTFANQRIEKLRGALASIAALHLNERQLNDIKKDSIVAYTDTIVAREALAQDDKDGV